MEKNRLYIIIASVAVIIGSVLPWGTVNLGGFLSVSGIEGDGKIVIVLAIGAIVLAILKDRTQPLIKNLAMGVVALGIIETAISIYALFRLGDMSANFGYGGYGISVGIGLYLTSIASIATFVLGLMAFSGGKTDAANVSKEFAQTVGRVTSATVKTAVNEIKKETDQPKDTETPASAEESKKVEADENKEEPTKLATEETVEKQVQAEPTVEEESLDAVVSDEAVESDKE